MDLVPERITFPEQEEKIANHWEKIDAFHTSIKRSEGKPIYSFYDGPPFATGLPHYGHILAGTIKDTVTRYAHQTGHYVERRFGWDCHGLPIEFEIDKELGIKTREQVLELGIPQYNAKCRAIVMRYAGEWERIVGRLGRWIDFKNDYKTMDVKFMESVWWVFKQIHNKGMVYRGFKVMPYSTGCTTPLSNFEANLAYKDVDDPAIVVAFPLEDEPDVSLVAWTTTPWTLPSNLALCLNPEMDYVKVFDKESKHTYIIAEKRLTELFKSPTDKNGAPLYEIKQKYKGKDLKGKKYKPLFPYFQQESKRGAFKVLTDNFVTDDSGTGVVHCAPAFGEDDYRVCMEAGVIEKGFDIPCPVDANGNFTKEVTDFAGKYVKNADKEIIKHLKGMGRLVHSGTIHHSYPFCWRSDTPLLYKAVPSWFVAVEKIRDKLLQNNKNSYWVPEYVQEKRFHNWLESAIDWAVSRNRYWGTPIPIWISDDGQEIVVIGSIAELEELSGVKGITDLHRESIDHITIPSKKGKGVLKRVEEVFDCWFESGSMPYAQVHYPFENKERFEKGFPADFIGEGIDQTRGWFYTLLVISTILFEKPPFKNLIVNGLVLAGDGKKMSKRLKNYPDPMRIVNEYGADALRLYLINSPVVRAENLKFQEKGVRDILKDAFLPWFNAYRFLVDSVVKYNLHNPTAPFKPNVQLALGSTNVMDKWILAATHGLISFVRKEMEAYRLYTVTPRLVQFIEELTNWYVRLNRKRLKASGPDGQVAVSTLFEVIYKTTLAMSPFTPFLTEYFYQNLRKIIPENEREDSVHYLMFPTPLKEALNPRIEEMIRRMQTVIQLGRLARDRRNTPLKMPLNSFTIVHKDAEFRKDMEELKVYIQGEMNVKEVKLTNDDSIVAFVAKPDFGALGKRLRKDLPKVQNAIKALTDEQIRLFQSQGKIEIEGHTITSEDMKIQREYKGDAAKNEAAWDNDVLTILDLTVDEAMMREGVAREAINRIQKLRKKAGVHPTDPIEVFYNVDSKAPLFGIIKDTKAFIKQTIGVPFTLSTHKPSYFHELARESADINGTALEIVLCVSEFTLSEEFKSKLNDDKLFSNVLTLLTTRNYHLLLKSFRDSGKLSFHIDGKNVELVFGKDVFASAEEKFEKH